MNVISFICALILFAATSAQATPGKDKCDDFNVVNFLFAASLGDLKTVEEYKNQPNFNLGAMDYDNRTALHLAASENHLQVAKFLLENGVSPTPLDRWGYQPIDDAKRYHHDQLIQVLEEAIAKQG